MNINTITTAAFEQYSNQHTVWHTYCKTAGGIIKIFHTELGIYQATFLDDQEIDEDKITESNTITTLLLIGTPFQHAIWQATLNIPTGRTISYQDLARAIQRPSAWRAVAHALAQNNIAYFIPCHRVIGKNGSMRGYRWGIEKKIALLHHEGAL